MDKRKCGDILGGVQMGDSIVLALTGSTRRQDLKRFAYGPDFIAESIADLAEEPFVEKILAKAHNWRAGSRDLAIAS